MSFMAYTPSSRGHGRPCCDKDFGGSHYHCGHCHEVSGMYGHFVTATFRDGTPFKGHTCAAGVRVVWERDGTKLLRFVVPVDACDHGLNIDDCGPCSVRGRR